MKIRYAILVLALVFAACGGDADGDKADEMTVSIYTYFSDDSFTIRNDSSTAITFVIDDNDQRGVIASGTSNTQVIRHGGTCNLTYSPASKVQPSDNTPGTSSRKGSITFIDVSNPSSTGPGNPTTLPSTPTGVRATTLSSSRVSVTWNPAVGAATYNVFYMRQTGDPAPIFAAQSGSPYICTGLQADTAYLFFVQAVNTVGESALSDPANARTAQLEQIPAAPQNVQAASNGNYGASISWNPVPGAASYKVYRSTAHASSSTPPGNTAEKTLTATVTVTSATVPRNNSYSSSYYYWFWVTAVNDAGESVFSERSSAVYAIFGTN
jgi:hypothetical protein